MRVVLQRVTEANVAVDGTVVGAIGHGLVALVGIAMVVYGVGTALAIRGARWGREPV